MTNLIAIVTAGLTYTIADEHLNNITRPIVATVLIIVCTIALIKESKGN